MHINSDVKNMIEKEMKLLSHCRKSDAVTSDA